MGLFDAFKKKKKSVELPPLPSDLHNEASGASNSPVVGDSQESSLSSLPSPSQKSPSQNLQSGNNLQSSASNVQDIPAENVHGNSQIPLPPSPDEVHPAKELSGTNDTNKVQENISNTTDNKPVGKEQGDPGAPEPPKPIDLGISPDKQNLQEGKSRDNTPNFKDLLEKHEVDNINMNSNSMYGEEKSESTVGDVQTQTSHNQETQSNFPDVLDELDSLNIDDLEIPAPDSKDTVGNIDENISEHVNKIVDEKLQEEEDANVLFSVPKKEDKAKKNEQAESEQSFNISYDNVDTNYEGSVFMELQNAEKIMQNVNESKEIISKTNLNYELLFDRQKKVVLKLRDIFEDINARLVKIDRKLF